MKKLDKNQVSQLSDVIDQITIHEAVTIDLLGEAVPQALLHVYGHNDTIYINKLVHALSPANKKVAIEFFDTYQSHVYKETAKDKRVKAYGKANKDTVIEKTAKAEKFMTVDPETGEANPKEGYYDGNYWLWVEEVVSIRNKDKDYGKLFDQALSNYLNKDKGKGDIESVIARIVKAQGVSIEDLLSIINPAKAA